MNEGSQTSGRLYGLETRVFPRWVRCLWFASLTFVNFPVLALAQPTCLGIHLTILNVRNSTGAITCALFESPVGFPAEVLHYAMAVVVTKIRNTKARCDFEDVPPGTYALVAIHDENRNGKLDVNWLGIPKEGYGFSNDVKAALGAPPFSDASFLYDRQNLQLSLTLHY